MRRKHTLEFVFLLTVIAFSLVGFSSLWLGESTQLTAYHYLHITTSLAWLLLLLTQLVVIRQGRFSRHRAIGKSIFIAGPLLVSSLTLLLANGLAVVHRQLVRHAERVVAGIPRQHRPHEVADQARRVHGTSAGLWPELADFWSFALAGVASQSGQTEEARCTRRGNGRLVFQ